MRRGGGGRGGRTGKLLRMLAPGRLAVEFRQRRGSAPQVEDESLGLVRRIVVVAPGQGPRDFIARQVAEESEVILGWSLRYG
jgi:hypothetical protein